MQQDKSGVFLYYWRCLGEQQYRIEQQYKFCPERRFRADICFPDQKIIVEIDGGVYGFSFYDKQTGDTVRRRGGHSSISGQEKDFERNNIAMGLGYRILRFTPQRLEKEPAKCIQEVLKALEYKNEK